MAHGSVRRGESGRWVGVDEADEDEVDEWFLGTSAPALGWEVTDGPAEGGRGCLMADRDRGSETANTRPPRLAAGAFWAWRSRPLAGRCISLDATSQVCRVREHSVARRPLPGTDQRQSAAHEADETASLAGLAFFVGIRCRSGLGLPSAVAMRKRAASSGARNRSSCRWVGQIPPETVVPLPLGLYGSCP